MLSDQRDRREAAKAAVGKRLTRDGPRGILRVPIRASAGEPQLRASHMILPTGERSVRELMRPGARHQRIRGLMAGLLAVVCAGCAAPFQKVATQAGPAPVPDGPPRTVREAKRPTVGVAFGGGSARGIAHVGVIRWLEEHRIPIDVAAGTSMGGLVGGAYATGMDAAELRTFITTLNWDQLFGASTFAYKNIRRKTDARAYPSRLEFGLKGGIVPPTALNSGQDVELLLGRIAAPYFDTAGLRRPADTVSNGCRRSSVCPASGDAKRVAGGRDARHHVPSADLSAHRGERTGADRRRHHGQRAGRHRESDGGGPRDRRQRRRSLRSRGSQLHDARRCQQIRSTR